MDSRRFAFIDALRGIASLGVVLFHAAEGHHIDQLPDFARQIAGVGAFGVPIFFVISGFVIACSLAEQQMTPSSFGKFLLRRSIRLDPAYWVAIAIALGFSALASKMISGRPENHFTCPQVLAHLIYAQSILRFEQINPVFWTLCYEVQFYVVFALLLFSKSRWTVIVAMIVSLLWCFRLAPSMPGLFTNLWYAFLLGASAWFGWRYQRFRLIYFAYFTAVSASAIYFRDSFALCTSLTSMTIFIAAASGRLSAMNWRWLQFLGAISYSLYLLHNPISGAVFRVGALLTGRSGSMETLWLIISTLCCVGSAAVLYKCVEEPSRRVSRAVFKPASPIESTR